MEGTPGAKSRYAKLKERSKTGLLTSLDIGFSIRILWR